MIFKGIISIASKAMLIMNYKKIIEYIFIFNSQESC